MATISSAGVGSGLDVKSLVTQLMATEQGRTTALTAKKTDFDAKLSSIGTLKSALSTLQQAAQTLNLSTTFSAVSASVADATVLSANVTGTSTAGSYDIAVKSLAQAQKLTSGSYDSKTSEVGIGTLTFDVGSYDTTDGNVAFNAKSGSEPVSITIDSSNNTLEGMRNAINNANAGVSASIINDGNGFRLALASKTSGTANALRIVASPDSADSTAALGKLAFDASKTVSSDGTTSLMQNVAPQNAEIEIDGIAITSASNTITDGIEGITLNLTKEMATGTTTKLTLTNDSSKARTAIEAFVTAYNAVSKQIADSTAYNVATGTASVMTGDSTMQTIQNQLRSTLSGKIAGAADGVSMLADVGISFQQDGTLAIDDTKLDKAMADPLKDLSKMFITSSDGSVGFGAKINNVTSKMIFGGDALLNSRVDGINASLKGISKQFENEALRLVNVEKRYNAQFSALDTLIASMTTTSSFLTQQFASLTANA
jgi:flagellar hook-associated protein 2